PVHQRAVPGVRQLHPDQLLRRRDPPRPDSSMNDREHLMSTLSLNARALVAMAALVMAAASSAQTKVPTINCYDPTDRPNPVYVAGSSAVRPFLGVVANQMAAETPSYTLVYQSQGSCTGVNAIFTTDPTKRVMKDIPQMGSTAANYAIIFKTDGSVQ